MNGATWSCANQGASMTITRYAIPALALALLSTDALAQLGQPIPSPATANAQQLVLRQGTAVRFSTESALSSKTTKEGDRFELRSTDPVYVGSLLVIPSGSRAVGEVTRVVKKGGFGKSGKMDTRILFVVLGDQHISMSGKANDEGKGGTAGTVAAAVLFWPVMPFVSGHSAEFPVGTTMTGYVENDLPVVGTAAPAARPLMVPVAATPETK